MAVQEKFDLVIRAQDEATATLRNVNREVQRVAGSSMPQLARSTDAASSAFTRADVKAAVLTGRLGGLPPAITQITSAFYLLGPQLAIIAAGVAIATDAYRANKAALDAHTEAVKLNAAALGELALRNDAVGEAARKRFESEKKGIEAQLISLEAAYAAFTNVEANKQAYVSEFGNDEKAMEGWAKAQEGMTRRAREMEEQINALKEQLAALKKPYEDHIALTNKDNSAIEKAIALRQTLLGLILKEGEFRGIGADASLRGPGYFGVPQDEVDKAKEEAEKAMQSIWAIPEAETRMIADAQAQWMEFSSMVLSSTDQLSAGITDMFFGLRDSLADVFRSMAANWIRYFINEILKQTALRLGFALFNVIFPGSGSLVGSAPGFGDVPITGGLARLAPSGGGGLDIVSAGAKRFSGGGPTGASTTVIIQGDVIGDEQYVNKRIIPAIENAIRYQKTTIAGR